MASVKGKKSTSEDTAPKVKVADRKTPKSLKPEPVLVKKSAKKSLNENATQTKRAKSISQVKARDEDQKETTAGGKQEGNASKSDNGKGSNLPHRSKEKIIHNEKLEEGSKVDQQADEKFAGLIFMCNSKTKPDCFRYHVMGVPISKQELVMGIKPGLKLFLYDYELRLLYGIYKASSAGGMRLEPAAFGGGFPAQVRFKVHRDCLPLPESIFKKAIKETYNEKTHKFKIELTLQQVKKLIELFRSTSHLPSRAQSSAQDSQPAPIICLPPLETRFGEDAGGEKYYRDHYVGDESTRGLMSSDYERNQIRRYPISPNPLFLTEKEYRSYGLRRERQTLDTATAPTSDAYRTDRGKEQIQMNPPSISGDGMRRDAACRDPLYLSEKDYRTFGLRREACATMTSAETASEKYLSDPYYPQNYSSSSSLVDRYLAPPRTAVIPSEPYSQTEREVHTSDYPYIEGDTRHLRGRVISNEVERMYPTYASRAQTEHDQEYHHLGGQHEATSASVSSRYSFAGPPLSYR